MNKPNNIRTLTVAMNAEMLELLASLCKSDAAAEYLQMAKEAAQAETGVVPVKITGNSTEFWEQHFSHLVMD